MPDMNDYHAFKSTTEGSSGGTGGGLGCGGFVLVILAIMLIYFIATGVSWDGIDSLLGIGFLVFLFVRWITTQVCEKRKRELNV